jgi:hypothetical protein
VRGRPGVRPLLAAVADAGSRLVIGLLFVVGTAAALHPRMSKLLRGVVAGWAAWKLGGGLIGTILLFIVLWWVLGHFGVFR